MTISTTTGGATIRYTTNGTTPSETVGTVYSSAVSISATCTLQAIAYENGYSDSRVASGLYTINAVPTTGLLLWLNAGAITGVNNGGSARHLAGQQRTGQQCHADVTTGIQPTYVTGDLNSQPAVTFHQREFAVYEHRLRLQRQPEHADRNRRAESIECQPLSLFQTEPSQPDNLCFDTVTDTVSHATRHHR